MKRAKDEMVNVVNEGSQQIVDFQHGRLPDGEANKFLVYKEVSKARIPKLNDVVDVLWDAQNEWFRGRLVKQRGRIRVFRFDVMYDDGDYLTHDLNEEHWRFSSDMTKTYEPGEVEELRRDLEEQSFSVPTNGATRKQRKSPRRCCECSMKEASYSMSEVPKMSQRRASKKRKENIATRSESTLPTLSVIQLGRYIFNSQSSGFEVLVDVTSPVSARSIYTTHSKRLRQEGDIDTSPRHSVASFASRNRDTQLPFRKRQVVRSSDKVGRT